MAASPQLPERCDDSLQEPALIHGAFLAQARATPSAMALHSRHGTCTYAELAHVSGGIAHALHRAEVQSGDTVAVLAERSPALVFALLGVLRSGATFLVLDAAYPAQRLAACAGQAQPAALLIAGDVEAHPALLEALRAPRAVLRVPSGSREAAVVFAGLEQPLPAVDPERIAYVSFTSGSTGTPKGIVATHAPLPHFIDWHIRHGALCSEDRFSMISGLGHDPVLRDIFTPLSLGASLHIPEQRTIFDADALWRWFAEQRISVCHMTPALGEILLTGAPEQGRLTSLRRVYWGGDVLRPRLAQRLAQLAPGVRQTNFYGTTETPQAMAYFDLDASVETQTQIPLGRGIDGAELLVVRDDGSLCETLETGEVWIASAYLARGYLHDDALTRARFVSRPHPQGGSVRCYRTGDRGQVRADGQVVFAGRGDHQLKIRGFRVEPAEVVSALEGLPGVERAVVLAQQRALAHEDTQTVLVAYVVAQRGHTLQEALLREGLRKQLPSYMQPHSIVVLSRFPLLANGKIDLQALATSEPCAASPAVGVPQGGAPRTLAERRMAELWAEILGISEVRIDQSFVEMGGDSLSAIRALARMKRLGVPDEVARGIFQGRTIAELCGQKPPSAETPPAPHGSAKITLLINLLRGTLVLLLVVDHWREGLLKRLPILSAEVMSTIEPLFRLPTPGFAFVFGVGLGHSQYAQYLTNPAAASRTLRAGAQVLFAGTVLMALSRNLGVVARHLPLDYDLFFTNFFLPTLYYAMALASAPYWFSLLARREGRWGGSMLAALLLAGAARVLYELCRMLLLPHEQTGLLQLGRLMLTARFSYFNLSTGALLGIFFGLLLRKRRGEPSQVKSLTLWGSAISLVGLAIYSVQRDRYPMGFLSPDINVPEWLLYVGVTLLLGAILERILLVATRPLLRQGLEWLSVVGQCAMPIFILQGVALDVSAFGRALGLRDGLAVLVSVGSFTLVVGYLMWRIHGLYYGTLAEKTPSGVEVARVST